MDLRLEDALAAFTEHESAAVLEHLVQARDGLITAGELITKLQADLGVTFETAIA